MKRFFFAAVFIIELILFSSSISLAYAPAIEDGLTYLSSNQNQDGSWGDAANLTDTYFTSAVAAEMLTVLGAQANPMCPAVAAWIGEQSPETTGELALRLIAIEPDGDDLDLLISYFDLYGAAWGGDVFFSNNHLDTALALLALKNANSNDSQINLIVGRSVNYLKGHQNADGGWGFTADDDSDVYTTAIVLRAAAQNRNYLLQTCIDHGIQYLLDHQNGDGGFGMGGTSTIFETALSFFALQESGADILTSTLNARNYLLGAQLADGSWNEDPYETALAIRALFLIQPNLTLSAGDVTFSPSMPLVGHSIDIFAEVHNKGFALAENTVVRFYHGDPAAGGVQLGTDQAIAALAGGQSETVSVSASFDGSGGRNLFVVVDPENSVNELNEDDNIASTRLWVATGPDLAVFSGDLRPTTYTPEPGVPFVLEYTLRNMGEAAVDAFSAEIYDGDPAGGGSLLQDVALSGLAGAASRTGTAAVTLQGSGSHTLYLVVDPDERIDETSESNNATSVIVQAGGSDSGADLVLTSADIHISPDKPMANEAVQIDIQAHNYGTETAADVIIELFNGDPSSGGLLLDAVTVTIEPGQTHTLTSAWTVPAGLHHLFAFADRDNAIIESDENNNMAVADIMADMVDIVVAASDLKLSPAYPVAGDTVSLAVTARNTGVSATGAFNLSLYDGDPGSGGILLQSVTVPDMAGGGDYTAFYTFTAEARTYRFHAVADQANQVVELFEENNAATRTMIIKGPGETYGPDLVPLEISMSDDTVTDAGTLQISGTVHVTFQNKGDEKIETPFDVLVYEDIDQDGTFTQGLDTTLGRLENDHPLWPNGGFGVDVPITGMISFLSAPVSALVDATDVISEQSENNNTLTSGNDCEVRPANPIEPVVEWRLTLPTNSGINQPPVIVNLTDDNGDGLVNAQDSPDIAYTYYNGHLTAVHGDSGLEIFTNTDLYTGSHAFTAAGDLDDDGMPEIVTVKYPHTGTEPYFSLPSLIVFEHDGALKWDNAEDIYNWNLANPSRRATITNASVPTIADINADGQPEIIVGGTCVNADGSIRWVRVKTSTYMGEGDLVGNWGNGSLVVDLDMDGTAEIVAGNTAYEHDGSLHWFNDTLRDGLNAVGNLDDDPYPEIALITIMSQQPHPTNGRLYLLEHDGTVKWGPVYLNDLPGVNYTGGVGGAPVIADFDGDGEAEVGTKALDYYFIFDKNGTIKNQYFIPYQSDGFYSAPTVFDLNGDGRPEVLIHSDRFFRIFDGPTADLLFEDSFGVAFNSSMNVFIADVDGDQNAEAVVIGMNHISGNDDLRVYGSAGNDWINARGVWSGLHYHSDNINDDGTIPQHEAPSWLTHNSYRCQQPVGEIANPYLTANLTASYLRAVRDGDGVTVTVRVGNGGAATADPNLEVDFYLGDAPGGTPIGSAGTTKPLAPGQYQDISFVYDGAVADGDLVTAVVDGLDQVPECNEQDNTAQIGYSQPVGLADLKLGSEDIILPDGVIAEGSLVSINASVHNIGSAAAGAFNVQLYNGNPSDGGQPIGSAQSIMAIGAGASQSVAFTLDTLGLAGTTMCYVVADPADQIEEQSEENNRAVFALNTVAPDLPNLTVAELQISPADAQPGQSVTISAKIENRGATTSGIPVRFYLDDPAAGGVPIFGQTIFADLTHGAGTNLQTSLGTTNLSGQYQIYVTVDPLDIIAESNEQDNSANQVLFVQSAGLSAQARTDKDSYGSGEPASITWSVGETAGRARQLTADVYILDANNNLMASLAAGQSVSLGANASVSTTYSWNTGSALNGAYTVVIELFEGLNKVARATADFTIAADKSLRVRVACDKTAYAANQAVVITATTISRSINGIFEDLRAQVQILAPDQSQLYSSDQTIATLMPEALHRFVRTWNSATHPAGQYTVVLDVYEGQTRLATAQYGFEISASSSGGPGLGGSLSVSPGLVAQGEDLVLASQIENRGNADLPELNVRILVVDPQSQTVADVIEKSIDLPMTTVWAEQTTYNSAGLAPGLYLAILQVQGAGFDTPKTLASARFEVEPGSLVQADLHSADPVNLLVWINENCPHGCDKHNHGQAHQDGHVERTCHQPERCVDIDLLEQLLAQTVNDHRLVFCPQEFAHEMRNPYHTDIMILGDHRSLPDKVRGELREKVFAGTGIISSLYEHPMAFKQESGKHHGPSSIYGVRSLGRLPGQRRQVQLVPSDLGVEATFEVQGPAEAVSPLDTAVVAGWLEGKGHGKPKKRSCTRGEDRPAVVLSRYGQGQTVYVAFDLGTNLTPDLYDPLAGMLAGAVDYIHRPASEPVLAPNELRAYELTLSSPVAVQVQIDQQLPEGFKRYDPSTDSWTQEQSWSIQLELDANADHSLMFYLLAPDQAGTHQLTTRVSSLNGGNLITAMELVSELSVDADTALLVNDIASMIKAMESGDPSTGRVGLALRLVERIGERDTTLKAALGKNIHDLLKIVRILSEGREAFAADLRIKVDALISDYAAAFYTFDQ